MSVYSDYAEIGAKLQAQAKVINRDIFYVID